MTVYRAEPTLRDQRRFVTDARDDLRRSPRVAWRLFRAGVTAGHRRAWLSHLWLLVPPVLGTAVWAAARSRQLIGVGDAGVPYPVYVLSGMILWYLFLDALNAPLVQLRDRRAVLARTRTPVEALVLAGIFDALFAFALRGAILVGAVVVYRVHVSWTVVLVPLGAVSLTLLGTAIGLLLAPAGLLADDVSRGLTAVTAVWFVLTPVFYVADPWWLVRWNPVTPLLRATRSWAIGGVGTALVPFGSVMAITLVALVAAWATMRVARPHLVARLG